MPCCCVLRAVQLLPTIITYDHYLRMNAIIVNHYTSRPVLGLNIGESHEGHRKWYMIDRA